MGFLLRLFGRAFDLPFGLLGAIDKMLPAGHQEITPGEISPNSGPIDVQM